jgi:septal ring factor EnvC (AmiA/AmiB activator)
MLVQYKVVDEVFGATRQGSANTKPVQLTLVSSTLTAREIISEKARSHFRSAIEESQKTPASRVDVAARLDKQINPFSTEEETVNAALIGFQTNKYFLFWNNEQVTSLDQKLQVLGDNDARFIRIIPLKGG